MKINESLFRGYDVRGIYPDEINEDLAYQLGASFVVLLEQNKQFGNIVAGYDARISSPDLFHAFCQGIVDQGRDVISLGQTSTPLFYFSVISARAAAGGMITASHNPKEYNGIKFVGEDAIPLGEANGGLRMLYNISRKALPRKLQQGVIRKSDFTESYISALLPKEKITRPVRCVIDASNGSAGDTARELLLRLALDDIPLFFNADGNFPHHPPDPLHKTSLDVAGKAVVKQKAEFGAIIDGDGDRIIFLDSAGEPIAPEIIGAFFVDRLFRGCRIVTTKSASKSLEHIIQTHGGERIFSRTGHVNIKHTMRMHDAIFGVEPSGHFYFADLHYIDSALSAFTRFISLFADGVKNISDIATTYRRYYGSGELHFSVTDGNAILDLLKQKYADGTIDEFDGVTVAYAHWWFNARLSRTEPLLRLHIEADSEDLMEAKTRELRAQITEQSDTAG